MVSLEQAGTAPAGTTGFVTYAASKTEAERTAWKWYEENKPGFVLNTVLPNFNVSSNCTALTNEMLMGLSPAGHDFQAG